ncbi:hypothetical protein SERLADRAFT_475162 [Serpula lacrymans var. lacrymans S7.9]|uniref:Uncharacterized protein n=1 Tax=Serpula lacrymans var. lacrymans (strain S7.9) TaxID=578457 RepID=F8P5Z1_SERL9|nr:uncharacterized protein SERLADRAFT_475162 [Serpula lacrymans var. lacrymans S7.9]EGO22028.1 hypothetical protein SERLADRAFT_475162 [Serpula lacrymans var. lacrymans S7.9]
MYALQSPLSTKLSPKSSPCALGALIDTTNSLRSTDVLPKHPRLPLSRSRKAPPTVSLTNANAISTCAHTHLPPSPLDLPDVKLQAQNAIPFPSFTVDVSSTPPFSESELDSLMTMSVSYPVDEVIGEITLGGSSSESAPWSPQIRLRRRRSEACTPRTKTQRRGSSRDKEGIDAVPPARKRSRKSRRLVSDLQFLATLHRSIVWRLRNVEQDETKDVMSDVDGSVHDSEELCSNKITEAQDKLLVRHLWQLLIDQGCTLVAFDDVPVASSSCSSSSSKDAASPLLSSNVSRSRRDDKVIRSRKRSSHSLTCPSVPSTSTSSPFFKFPHQLSISVPAAVPSTDPPSPTTPSPTSDPARILSMPQLVASLLLQQNQKRTTRARPRWRACCRRAESTSHDGGGGSPGPQTSSNGRKCVYCHKEKKSKSPLSTVAFSALES